MKAWTGTNTQSFEYGEGTKIYQYCNLYGCIIGKNCNIGAYVEIGPNVVIGDNVTIGAFTYIPEGVKIRNDIFIGPRVTFLNDKYPPSKGRWKSYFRTLVDNNVVIGGGAIILPGITLCNGCVIGAGSVVTKSIDVEHTVVGNPASEFDRHKKPSVYYLPLYG